MSMIEKEVSSFFDEGKAFPPGFRFHPTDEELVLYHLKGKMCHRRLRLDVIGETDVYKWEPEELPEISKLKTGDRQWFFFSPRDRRYPNGARANRTTRHGYWKVTGKDRIIACNSRSVGVKKTLVFYEGRSPNGERTDWVMHEYTLTEEELKRCQSIKDYYALYKVYKKSGPGPKNGEQYGAPFREEDWADEEVAASDPVQPVNSLKQVEAPIPVSDYGVNAELQSRVNDFEEFMNIIANDPVSVQPLPVDYGFSLEDLVGEEVTHNNFMDEASRGISLPEQNLMLQPACQHYNGQASFGIMNISYLRNEAPEVTYTAASHLPGSNLAEENLEDFLEMDDLTCLSDFTVQHSDKPTQELGNLQFDEFADALGEFDLYKDLAAFLDEDEAGDELSISQQDISNLTNGVVNPVSVFSNYDFEEGAVNLQQSYLLNGSDTNFLQCLHDQRHNVYTSAEARQETISLATSGVVYESNSAKQQTGASKSNSSKQDVLGEGTDSWFSSKLWNFVESIPSSPASAAENALVNRAFERMSSFSKLRINSQSVVVAAAGTSTTSISSGKRISALLCFSFLGILFAILWMWR